MDGLLAYMYTMIEECRKKGIRLDRDYLVSCGHAIELFPGVQDWFSRINAFGETLGVESDTTCSPPAARDHRGQRREPRI